MTQPDLEPQLRRWKRLALGAGIAAGVCILLAILLLWGRVAWSGDPRLVGVWVCDHQRTMERARQAMSPNVKFEALDRLYSEMRYVYDGSRWCMDVGKGKKVDWYRYEVIGRDAHSVVIRTIDPLPPDLDHLELSQFTVIHFESKDRFWVEEPYLGVREYYRRAK